MPSIRMHDSMVKLLTDASYAAYEAGELSDEDYSDAMSTLVKGIPQDPNCPGRVFHRNPGHICEPPED